MIHTKIKPGQIWLKTRVSFNPKETYYLTLSEVPNAISRCRIWKLLNLEDGTVLVTVTLDMKTKSFTWKKIL